MADDEFFPVVPLGPEEGGSGRRNASDKTVAPRYTQLRFLCWCIATIPIDLFVTGGALGSVCTVLRAWWSIAPGWVCAVALEVPWPACAALLFSLTVLSIKAILFAVGAGALQGAVVFCAGMAWLLLLVRTAKNKFRGGVLAVHFLGTFCSAVFFLSNTAKLDPKLPEGLQGVIIPCTVPLFQSLAYYSFVLSWSRVEGTGSSCSFNGQTTAFAAAMVTQSCDCMRLAGFFSAALVPQASALWRRAVATFVLSVVSDVVGRSMLFWSLLYRLFGWVYDVSPETQQLLRSRFVFGYTPFLPYAAFLAEAAMESDLRTSRVLAGLYTLALAAELASDVLTVLLQGWLAGDRSSFFATLHRLTSTGGHVALGARRLAAEHEPMGQVVGRIESPVPTVSELGEVVCHSPQLPGAVEDADDPEFLATDSAANFHSEATSGSRRTAATPPSCCTAAMFELALAGGCWKVTESAIDAYFGACRWRTVC